jgi:hypothetical protein
MILLWQSPCPDFGSDGGHPSMTTEQESPAAVKLIVADRQMVEVRFITIVLGEIRHSIIKSYGILSHRGISFNLDSIDSPKSGDHLYYLLLNVAIKQ